MLKCKSLVEVISQIIISLISLISLLSLISLIIPSITLDVSA